MLIISGANQKIQLVTDAAADVERQVSFVENNAGAITPDNLNDANITSATTTDILPVAGASKQRAVKHINLRNAHASQSVLATVQVTDGSVVSTLAQATLLPGEVLVLDETGGWSHYDVNMGLYPAVGSLASQSDMEGAAVLDKVVTPGRLHYHPGVAKAWVVAGVTGNILASYNITSLTDTGTGVMGITIATDFSSVNYAVNVSVEAPATTWAVANCRECHIRNATLAVGTVSVDCVDNTATTSLVKDPATWHVTMYGDQA